MDDVPPDHPADRTVSRRGVLIGGGIAVLAAAGGGIALGVATEPAAGEHPSTAARIPAELAAAVAAETALIAHVDSALGTARPHVRRALREIRADHVAHLAALRAAIADDVYPLTTPSASASGSVSGSVPPPSPAPVPTPDVRAGELRASRAAAARAARLSGRDAALLASIAASEACHAELLA
ncbi:MAG TPA: hypothetical protein VH395_02600 [Jatrophihabitantaceae bacterium]|jgi:hypothetical protein